MIKLMRNGENGKLKTLVYDKGPSASAIRNRYVGKQQQSDELS